jgi:hypothetical protein
VRYRPDLPYLAAPDTLDVCVYGYAASREVRLEVSDPSGNLVESQRLTPDDLVQHNAFTFRRLHSDPMGLYTATVTQGDMTASVIIDVRPAPGPQFIGIFDHPRGLPLDGGGTIAKPGAKIQVALGGYQPNATVLLHIYNNPHAEENENSAVIDYLTSYPVTVDSAGGGIWELQTASTDPEDIYVLHSELVTRRMYPAPDAPEAPSIRWEVYFLLSSFILE